jgi:hypothetical protein
MSQEDVELIRSLYRARDPSRWFDLLDEEVELDFTAYPVPDSAVMHVPEMAGFSSSMTSEDAGSGAGCSLLAGGPSSLPCAGAGW